MNKWLSLQAASNIPSTPADRLKTLMADDTVFDIRNPNKVKAPPRQASPSFPSSPE